MIGTFAIFHYHTFPRSETYISQFKADNDT